MQETCVLCEKDLCLPPMKVEIDFNDPTNDPKTLCLECFRQLRIIFQELMED